MEVNGTERGVTVAEQVVGRKEKALDMSNGACHKIQKGNIYRYQRRIQDQKQRKVMETVTVFCIPQLQEIFLTNLKVSLSPMGVEMEVIMGMDHFVVLEVAAQIQTEQMEQTELIILLQQQHLHLRECYGHQLNQK